MRQIASESSACEDLKQKHRQHAFVAEHDITDSNITMLSTELCKHQQNIRNRYTEFSRDAAESKQLCSTCVFLRLSNRQGNKQTLQHVITDLSTSAGLEMSAPMVMASPPESSMMCATSSAGPDEEE